MTFQDFWAQALGDWAVLFPPWKLDTFLEASKKSHDADPRCCEAAQDSCTGRGHAEKDAQPAPIVSAIQAEVPDTHCKPLNFGTAYYTTIDKWTHILSEYSTGSTITAA